MTRQTIGVQLKGGKCVTLVDNDLLSVQAVRTLARNSRNAQRKLADMDSEAIDRILKSMVRAAEEHADALAEMAVKETGFGKVADKAFKNRFASSGVYRSIKDMVTVGVIKEDAAKKVIEIAEPVGVLMGIIPSTNPTSTAIYKAMIAIKTRNTIVMSPHPSALNCTLRASDLMREAAVAAGAPDDCISCIALPSMEATNALMRMPEIAMIIATGGAAMVKSAYSVGKPALGVGPGNVPTFIERTADIPKAVQRIIASKTFDYGTICASEQSVIVESCSRDRVMAEFRNQGGYFMTAEETQKVAQALFNGGGHAMNAALVGRSPQEIAEKTGIKIPHGTTVLLGEQHGVGKEWPLSYEKLTTVLGFYTVKDWEEACALSIGLIQNGGVGHSLSLHTEDRGMVMKFAAKPVFRILVNSPSSQGGVGATTGLAPSFTLGSGTWGGSSTSDNVTPMHLINIKRIAYGITEPEHVLRPLESAAPMQRDISPELVAEIVGRVMKRMEGRGK